MKCHLKMQIYIIQAKTRKGSHASLCSDVGSLYLLPSPIEDLGPLAPSNSSSATFIMTTWQCGCYRQATLILCLSQVFLHAKYPYGRHTQIVINLKDGAL